MKTGKFNCKTGKAEFNFYQKKTTSYCSRFPHAEFLGEIKGGNSEYLNSNPPVFFFVLNFLSNSN